MNISGRKRGLALIFSHANFLKSDSQPRSATTFDNNRLTSLLESFYFEVKLCKDYKAEEISKELLEVSKMDHSNYDCLAIFVMSHGKLGEILAQDDYYNISDLWSYFTQKNCPTLTGKPKLFFIQACRGSERDSGITMQFPSDNYNQSSPSSTPTVTDAKPDFPKPEHNEVYRTPDEPDFLIAYSTVPGYVAYNRPNFGSWFMQELCHILEEYGRNYDLLALLTFVAQRIAIDFDAPLSFTDYDGKKQITSTLSTLERPLYFFPAEMKNVPKKIMLAP